jgi:hypothetical protein
VRVVTFGFQEAVISFSPWIHHHFWYYEETPVFCHSRLKKSSLHQTSYWVFLTNKHHVWGPTSLSPSRFLHQLLGCGFFVDIFPDFLDKGRLIPCG